MRRPAKIARTPVLGRLAALASTATIATLASGAPAPASNGADPAALGSRVISLNESARLHLTSRHGFTLNEQGSASGSVSGTMYVHLTIVSTSRVIAEVNFYPHGGSISGQASASYRRGSSTASFSGTLSITQGTGGYAHARGSGLSFSGTIRRSDEAIAVQVHGTASV
jgi:hypothetical protein